APGAPALGPATQQAIGRLFTTDYKASPESWAAAGVLDAAVHTRNPLRAILLHLSGRLQRSRRLLADLVHGDLAGVYATGIAVHNLVRGFERMRELWSEPRWRSPSSVDAVVEQCAPITCRVHKAMPPSACSTSADATPPSTRP